MHDNDDESSLSGNDATAGNNRYANDLMIVNTLHVNSMSSSEDYANITSGDTTIGTAINK